MIFIIYKHVDGTEWKHSGPSVVLVVDAVDVADDYLMNGSGPLWVCVCVCVCVCPPIDSLRAAHN